MRLAAIILTLFAISGAANAQTPAHTTKERVLAALPELDRLARRLIADERVPGMAIAVVYKDEVVFLKGYGVRQVGRDAAVDGDTVFQIASMSKPISSTIVARLVGERTVTWATRVRNIDPAFKLYDASDTARVTIGDLFAHRSGLWGDAGNGIESLGFGRDEILRRLRYLKPAGKLSPTAISA